MELIKLGFVNGAVNELSVTNAKTNSGPVLSATGDDTNIDLSIYPKGTGNLILDGLKWPNLDGNPNQVMVTDGAGNINFADANILTINEKETSSNVLIEISRKKTSNDTVCLIDATIVARSNTSQVNVYEEGAGFILRGLFRNDNNTLTKIGEDKVSVADNGNNWNVACEVDGADILIKVSGGSLNKTVKWKCSYKCTYVG